MIVDDDFYNEIKRKILYDDEPLTKDDYLKLKQFVQMLDDEIFKSHKELLEIGKLLNYNDLKEKGFSAQKIQQFNKDDEAFVEKAQKVYNEHVDIDHSQMFGYPANMMKDSYVTSYLRWLESKMYFMNNCGDAYNPGNYRMHTFDSELKIILEIIDNLGLSKDKYKGYINSGGTEGIYWGLREGVTKYPNSIVYYSDNAHYSVEKYLSTIQSSPMNMILTVNGKIDVDELLRKIVYNYNVHGKDAVILLTGGTTALGSCDDVKTIKERLNDLNIPNYIHFDAALYGGIPKNQSDSPMVDIGGLDIDSISVSLHKYLGNTQVNGILLSKTKENSKMVDYIGQEDYTFLGSRSVLPFSTLQRIVEINHRSCEDDYIKNVHFFTKLLMDNGIKFTKGDENGNIFIIDKPSDEICKKYQLATFNYMDNECAHIIIFPYHNEEDMIKLVDDIKNEKKLVIKKEK